MNIGSYDNIQSLRPVNSPAREDFDILSKNEKSSLYLPALRRVEFQPNNIKVTEEKENKSNRKKEDIFNELENFTILLKNSSSGKKYLREKVENFPPGWDELFAKARSQKNSSSEDKDSSGEYHDSDQQRAEKILESYNRDYLGKLIKKDKDIISAISNACRGIFDFIEKVANHLSSVSDEKKIQNMTSMKGLVFDIAA